MLWVCGARPFKHPDVAAGRLLWFNKNLFRGFIKLCAVINSHSCLGLKGYLFSFQYEKLSGTAQGLTALWHA